MNTSRFSIPDGVPEAERLTARQVVECGPGRPGPLSTVAPFHAGGSDDTSRAKSARPKRDRGPALHDAGAAANGPAQNRGVQKSGGFSLIEMLVVIGIIIAIVGIALPNIRGFREGAEMEAASRQLIADLSLARARAINARTTVAMVFIPYDILEMSTAGYNGKEIDQIKQLQGGVYTQYALFAARRVGDQPGHNNPRYVTDWKTLPEKTFIAEYKFSTNTPLPQFDYALFPLPFDTTTKAVPLPYVAFDYEGRPCKADGSRLDAGMDLRIPLARGAILYLRDITGGVKLDTFSIQEVPPNNSILTPNHIVIDWLTGRARLERAEI
jgi:hypothetical protein